MLPYYKLDVLFRSAADLGRTGETDEAIDSLVSPIRALKWITRDSLYNITR